MKKSTMLLSFLLALCLSLPAAAAQKLAAMPAVFAVKAVSEERYEGDRTAYIYKEYLETANPAVNAELRALVDAFDARYAPLLTGQASQKAKLYNRLDIEVTYYRTGNAALSAMVTARNTWKKQPRDVFFSTRTYDLNTGRRVLLTDLFAPGSPAWALLSGRVSDTLSNFFPGESRDAARVAQLAARGALEEADFTLSGMELTLHYDVRALFPEKTGLMHVRFYYPELEGMLTDAGARYTDNSQWKMVAITCDDGPRGAGTDKALARFRQNGIRATFFTVGKLYDENYALLRREYDGNHTVANHSWNHWNGHGLQHPARLTQVAKVQDYVLAHLGEPSPFFRAPGGTYPPWVESKIGLPIIQWSVDTYDFKGLSASDILANVRKFTREGDIILMHDTGEVMHKTIDAIAEYLYANGFMPVTVQELARAQQVELLPDTVYHRFIGGDWSERRDSNTN